MDINNPVIQLCIQGTQAEFRGNIQQACREYEKAWKIAQNDYEACIAAHYLARHQENPQDALRWNAEALRSAEAFQRAQAETVPRLQGPDVAEFLPSLYLNMGQSYERLGDLTEANRYYEVAASLGFPHQD